MDTDLPFLAVCALLACAALATAALWLRRQRLPAVVSPIQVARERERRARELGWAYDETAVRGTVFTVRGANDGIKWKVRYRVDTSQPHPRSTLTWASRTVQGSATELRLIGRARYERRKLAAEPATSSVVLSARDIATAQARADFVERTPPTHVGSAHFRDRYVVVARNERLARALIDHKVEGLLTAWAGRPEAHPEDLLTVWLDWQGLRVDLDAAWTAMRDIEHLTAIGLALAAGYRRHAAAPRVTRWMPSPPGHAI